MNIKEFKYKTELHLHTSPGSRCGHLSPEEAVEIYANLGYHSIVVSNHLNSTWNPWKSDKKQGQLAEYLSDYDRAVIAGKKYGINVILGCEITFTENLNDYLLFGIEKEDIYDAYDYMNLGLAVFSKHFRKQSTLLIQAHPFRDNMTEMPVEYLDGIEVFNMHPGHNSRVALAAAHARKHNLIKTGGSDFHRIFHKGTCALLTKSEIKTSHDIVEVLRSGDYLFEITGSIVIP